MPVDGRGSQPRLRRGVLFLFGAARSPAYAPGWAEGAAGPIPQLPGAGVARLFPGAGCCPA